jgi:hypothetical protein
MKLPNVEHAVIDIAKLRTYSLNHLHEAGQHKARVFQAALSISIDDAEWLREMLLIAVADSEAVVGAPSPFGTKYVVDVLIVRGERSAIVRTAWIIEHGIDFPRLTSCYVR